MSDLLSVAECLLSNSWTMLKSVEFPGLGVPVASLMVSLFLIGLSFRVLGFVLSFSIGHGSSSERGSGLGNRPVNSNTPRIGGGGGLMKR